jgi:hypothetical protein
MFKSIKLILLACWALALAVPAVAQIGGVGWSLKPLKFHVQSPTNASQSARYFVTNNPLPTYHCLVYSTDGAFSVGNTTKPRTEQRFDPDYTSGIIQYQATLMAPANENSYSIFQIHTGDAQSPTFGSTTFMAFWFTNYNGSLRDYSGTTLATNLGNRWFTLNCDHNLNAGLITVWINGNVVWQQADNGAGDFYFKDGVYEQSHNPTYQMDAYVTNILIWTNLTTSEFSGFYEIESANSPLAASVRASPVTNGAAIVQSNFVAGANSLWYFVPTDSGYYRVMNVGSGLALAVQNSSTDSGALVVQQSYLKDGSADWLPGWNGVNVNTYSFTNRLSGKVLDVPGASKSQDIQLDQLPFSGGANQKWLLIPCGNVVSNSVLAPALASVFTNGNKIGLQLNGVPGARYLVQATTNLTSPNWQPVFTNTADRFGNCMFTDTNSTTRPDRFYRTVLQ